MCERSTMASYYERVAGCLSTRRLRPRCGKLIPLKAGPLLPDPGRASSMPGGFPAKQSALNSDAQQEEEDEDQPRQLRAEMKCAED